MLCVWAFVFLSVFAICTFYSLPWERASTGRQFLHTKCIIALLRPGIVPKDDLVGNAWKQSAMEAWLPLVDILVSAVANKVPAPAAPPSNSVPWLI